MYVSNHSTLIQQVSNIGLKAFIQINCSELLQSTNSCTYVYRGLCYTWVCVGFLIVQYFVPWK